MATLYLKFAVVLEDFSIEPYSLQEGKRHHGPLFHRWLPEGEKNALKLKTTDAKADVTVWFEQTGYVENGRIIFDYDRAEVDAKLIQEQDVLDAGPLRGLCVLRDVTDDELIALHESLSDEPAYVNLGRRVAHLLHPPLARFVNVLRSNFGQYWVSELKEWNPREQSLGSYFETIIQTKWNLDNGEIWKDFVPEKPQFSPRVTADEPVDPRAYMTQEDWAELEVLMTQDYRPELAAMALVRAHKLLEGNSLKQALVEGVTALEIAMNEFIGRKIRGNKQFHDRLQSFWSMPLSAQLLTVAATLNTPLPEMESALRAIDVRHRMVHEGWEPPATVKADVRNLLRTIGALLPGPKFRFPSYHIPEPRPQPEGLEAEPTPPAEPTE